MCRKAQQCSGNSESQRPQDGYVAPLAWSLKLCVWTVRLSWVNLQCWGSVEKSGWRVCNTDHTGSQWRASAPAENPAVPCMCCEWKTCFTGELTISPCLRSCQFGFMSLEGADSIFHCVINDVLHLQFILMVCMSVREMPEFLRQAETVLYMFWRYKVFCYFYATV